MRSAMNQLKIVVRLVLAVALVVQAVSVFKLPGDLLAGAETGTEDGEPL